MPSPIQEIEAKLAEMPLTIGLSQFRLANHKKADGQTCYNNEALVQGPVNALQRAAIAGTAQNLSCTGCGAKFPDVQIPANFH